MRKYIDVTKKVQQELINDFKVSDRTVYNAINYDPQRGGSKLARQIRKTAREKGGVTYYVVESPEVWFDSEGSMHQVFANGAEIVIDKATGDGQVIYRGEVKAEYPSVMMAEIADMQEYARSFAQ